MRLALKRVVTALGLALLVSSAGCGKKADEAAVEAAEVEVLEPSVLEELSVEAAQLEKIRTGWKAKIYQGTRKGLVKSALGLIGAVGGQSSHPLLQHLPAEVRGAIEATAGEAGNLKVMAESPPAELSLVVATGYLVNLQKTPALCELELIDESAFRTPGGKAGFLVVRGVTYFMHGLKQHGLRDLRAANVGSGQDLAPEVRLALLCSAAAAAVVADEPRMCRTQLELAEEIAPADPLIVLLRAEGDISKSRFDEAAEGLAAWRVGNPGAAGVVPRVIDQRIRQLQEADGLIDTVLVEPTWLVNFGLDYIAEQAETSAAFRKLDGVTGSARSLMTGLLDKFSIPGS